MLANYMRKFGDIDEPITFLIEQLKKHISSGVPTIAEAIRKQSKEIIEGIGMRRKCCVLDKIV